MSPAQDAVVEHVTSFFSARSVEVSPFGDGPIAERVTGTRDDPPSPDARFSPHR